MKPYSNYCFQSRYNLQKSRRFTQLALQRLQQILSASEYDRNDALRSIMASVGGEHPARFNQLLIHAGAQLLQERDERRFKNTPQQAAA